MTWARARARARGGKIINTALLIPAGTIYTMEAPVSQGGVPGGPNLMEAVKFHDTGTATKPHSIM